MTVYVIYWSSVVYYNTGEPLKEILENFLNFRQNIIYYITQSFTFIYAFRLVKIPPDNKIRAAETLDPLTKMPSLVFRKK